MLLAETVRVRRIRVGLLVCRIIRTLIITGYNIDPIEMTSRFK